MSVSINSEVEQSFVIVVQIRIMMMNIVFNTVNLTQTIAQIQVNSFEIYFSVCVVFLLLFVLFLFVCLFK